MLCPVRGVQLEGGRAAGPGAASRERCGGAGRPGALRAVPALVFIGSDRGAALLCLFGQLPSPSKNQIKWKKKKNPDFFIFFLLV